MNLPLEALSDSFAGYEIVDCVVASRTEFYFVLIEITSGNVGSSTKKRVVKIDTLKGAVNYLELIGFEHLIYCEMSFEPEGKPIVMDAYANVWSNNPGTNGIEKPIASKFDGGCLTGAINRIKSFGGYAICCSNNRDMLIRDGVGQWRPLGPEISFDDDQRIRGFNDFDAFSMDDIYAVGGLSDVFHFDGTVWEKLEFPSHWGPSAVCCADDGFVYIGMSFNCVYKGRGNEWRRIHKGGPSEPFVDMVWHEGKVWCASKTGLFTIVDDVVYEDEMSSDFPTNRYLSVRDNSLLLSTGHSARVLIDGQWHALFGV